MQAAECNYRLREESGQSLLHASSLCPVQPRRLTGLFVIASAAYAWEPQRFNNCIKAESREQRLVHKSTLLLLLSFSL